MLHTRVLLAVDEGGTTVQDHLGRGVRPRHAVHKPHEVNQHQDADQRRPAHDVTSFDRDLLTFDRPWRYRGATELLFIVKVPLVPWEGNVCNAWNVGLFGVGLGNLQVEEVCQVGHREVLQG